MDILKRLYENQISEEEAEKIVDEMIECFHGGKLKNRIEEILQLDTYEYTAWMYEKIHLSFCLRAGAF